MESLSMVYPLEGIIMEYLAGDSLFYELFKTFSPKQCERELIRIASSLFGEKIGLGASSYYLQHVSLPPEGLLVKAAHDNMEVIIEKLLQDGVDVNAFGGRALIEAVRGGFQPMINLLIDHKADVNAGDGKPLIEATMCGSLPLILRLIGEGANPHLRDEAAAVIANNYNLFEIMDYFAEIGVHPNDPEEGISLDNEDHYDYALEGDMDFPGEEMFWKDGIWTGKMAWKDRPLIE